MSVPHRPLAWVQFRAFLRVHAVFAGCLLIPGAFASKGNDASDAPFQVPLAWEYSPPLIEPEHRISNPNHAQKDPSLVFYNGKWHVFMTVKLPGRSAIEYCSFEKWEKANASERTLIKVSDSDYY